jgi:hypothetical protein
MDTNFGIAEGGAPGDLIIESLRRGEGAATPLHSLMRARVC